MRLPAVAVEPCNSPPCRDGRPPFQRGMSSMHVGEILEGFQLLFQVQRGPEQHSVHTLSPQRANQPLDKRMGHGDIRHTLDFGHAKHPQVGVPLVEPVQRIMIGAKACRTEWSSNRMAEHAAQGSAIHDAGMDTKADDPPGVVVHHHQDPMAAEQRGLAAEQVDAPEAILRLPQQRQPGGTTPARTRSIMRRKDPALDRRSSPATYVEDSDLRLPNVFLRRLFKPQLECVATLGEVGAGHLSGPSVSIRLKRV